MTPSPPSCTTSQLFDLEMIQDTSLFILRLNSSPIGARGLGMVSVRQKIPRKPWTLKGQQDPLQGVLLHSLGGRALLLQLWSLLHYNLGFPGGTSGKEPTCQCGRHRFNPQVGEIPWRREWLPTPVFVPGESHGQRSLVGYSPCMGSQRVRHN